MKSLRSLFFVFAAALLLSSCEKEMSFESGNALGILTDDASGDCLPVSVNGTYTVGTALTTANSLDVQANFSQEGSYTIKSDTINGYSFLAVGTMGISGLKTIHLIASGTPANIGTGVDVFHIGLGTDSCEVDVVLAGGSGGGGGGGGGGGTTGTLTTTINGVTKTYTDATATYDASVGVPNIDIDGFDAATGEEIDITLINPLGSSIPAGSYNVNQTTVVLNADYQNAAGDNFNAVTGGTNPTPAFTVVLSNAITGATGTASGSFTGALADSGSGTTVTVSGTFNIPVQ